MTRENNELYQRTINYNEQRAQRMITKSVCYASCGSGTRLWWLEPFLQGDNVGAVVFELAVNGSAGFPGGVGPVVLGRFARMLPHHWPAEGPGGAAFVRTIPTPLALHHLGSQTTIYGQFKDHGSNIITLEKRLKPPQSR